MSIISNFAAKRKQDISFSYIKRTVKPKKSFHEIPSPPNTDYSSLNSWVVHPKVNSHIGMTPQGNDSGSLEADVFFVHPTVCFSKNSWNAALDHPKSTELLEETIVPSQMTIFNECRVFAPRYRQATFYSFFDIEGNGLNALDVAFTDVRAAFEYYLNYENNGRPFIIAGHSQGALHGIRLLETIVDPTASIREKFISAYLIGFQIPRDKLDRTLHHIMQAQSASDLKTIIAFDTFGVDGMPVHRRDNCQHFYPDTNEWEYRRNKDVIATNPLNWTSDNSLAEKHLHKGAIKLNFAKDSTFDWKNYFADEKMGLKAGSLSRPILQEVSCSLDIHGILHISKPKTRTFRMGLLPNWNYHIHDLNLFYMNLKENVRARVTAHLLT